MEECKLDETKNQKITNSQLSLIIDFTQEQSSSCSSSKGNKKLKIIIGCIIGLLIVIVIGIIIIGVILRKEITSSRIWKDNDEEFTRGHGYNKEDRVNLTTSL